MSQRKKRSARLTENSKAGANISITATAQHPLRRCSVLSATGCGAGSGGSTNVPKDNTSITPMSCCMSDMDSGNCPLGPHGDMHSRRPTDEGSSESRTREIRPSGLMRGGEMQSETDNCGRFNSPTSLRLLYPNPTPTSHQKVDCFPLAFALGNSLVIPGCAGLLADPRQ